MTLKLVPKHSSLAIPCPGCEFRLSMAHPTLGDWFRAVVKTNFAHAHVSWTFRNEAQQEECFRKGTSSLHWPYSKHNVLASDGRPMSKAIDLFEQLPNGQACFEDSFYEMVWELTRQSGRPIKWGGKFKPKADAPHFELLEAQQSTPVAPHWPPAGPDGPAA